MVIAQPLDPVPSSSVLLDNSTYFSAKVAVQESVLDSQSVFNLATFVEAIVLKESVFLAPTSNWKPGADDEPLFGTSSPCHSMTLQSFSPEQLHEIFRAALESSISDLRDEALILHTPYGLNRDIAGTRSALLAWRGALEENLDDFLETYSAKVFGTDEATSRFLKTLPATRSEDQQPDKHFAHYLLRTNTAFELSRFIPYLPHSNRIRFVLKKLGATLSGEGDPGINLLRVTERSFPADIPLILSVILSGSRTPDDILGRALELRKHKAAQRYREWSSKLIQAWTSDDKQRQQTAAAEFDASRITLAAELEKLHSGKSVALRLWTYLKERLPYALDKQKRPELARQVLADGEGCLSRFQTKRRVAILIELARDSAESGAAELGDHLSRVFGKSYRLDPEELKNVHFLRSELR